MDTTKNVGQEIPGEIVPLTPEQQAEFDAYNAPEAVYAREYEVVRIQRHAAYIAPDGSDAIFMKYQRDEATKEEWLAAKAAIDEALPYPEPPKPSKKKAS
jgi:hypothetical protein